MARFVTGLRVVAALAAGAAGMPWRCFFLANLAGALVWASSMALLGYFFGHTWQKLHHWLGWASWILLGGVVLIVALRFVLVRLPWPGRRTNEKPRSDL